MAGTTRLVLDRRWGSGRRALWRRGEAGSATGRVAAVFFVLGRRGQVDEEEAGHQWAPPAVQRHGRLPARREGTWE
jgi:hypothetical protein